MKNAAKKGKWTENMRLATILKYQAESNHFISFPLYFPFFGYSIINYSYTLLYINLNIKPALAL